MVISFGQIVLTNLGDDRISCFPFRLTFGFFPLKLAACSKPPSRENHRKAPYPREQQREHGGGKTQIMRDRRKNDACKKLLLRSSSKRDTAKQNKKTIYELRTTFINAKMRTAECHNFET